MPLERPMNLDTLDPIGGREDGLTEHNQTPPVTDLYGWWDASDASSLTVASDLVSQWNDLSGNGFHLTQGTGAAKPGYGGSRNRTMSGITVVDFDGGDEISNASIAMGPTLNCQMSIFIAIEIDTGGTVIGSTGGAASFQRVIDFAAAGSAARYYSLGGAAPVTHPHAPSTGQPTVLGTAFARGGFLRWQRDAVLQETSYGGTIFSGDGLRLANRGDGIDYNGAVAEVMVYRRFLDDEEFFDTMQYLRGKWGTP